MSNVANNSVEITVTANADAEDCLADAAATYIDENSELVGYDLAPRWTDDDRETVTLTVPVWATRAVTITASISDGMTRNAGGETVITAGTLDEAIEQAEEWVRAGDYTTSDSSGIVTVSLVIVRDGAVIERRSVVADATCEAQS